MKSVFVSLLLSSIIIVGNASPQPPTFAEDPFPQTFTSCDGSMSFQYPANMVVDEGKEIIHVSYPDGIGNGHLYLEIESTPRRSIPSTPEILNTLSRLDPQFAPESEETVFPGREASQRSFTRTENDYVFEGYLLSLFWGASDQAYYELWAVAEADEQTWEHFADIATDVVNTLEFNPLVNLPSRNNELYQKFYTEHCVTSFEYPAEWTLMEYNHQLLLFNSEPSQFDYFSGRFGSEHLAVKIILPEQVNTLVDSAQTGNAEAVLRQFAEANGWELDRDIVITQINQYRTLKGTFTEERRDDVRSGFMAVLELDDQYLILSAVSSEGNIDAYSQTIDEILLSVRYSTDAG